MAVPNIRVPLAFGAVVTGGQPNLRTPFVFAEPLTGGEANVRASYLFAEPLTGGNPNLRVAFVRRGPDPRARGAARGDTRLPDAPGRLGPQEKPEGYNTGRAAQHVGPRGANAFQTYPDLDLRMTYEFLRDDNVANGYTTATCGRSAGFSSSWQGRYEAFLFHDPDDYRVLPAAIATADGVTCSGRSWKDGDFGEDGTVTNMSLSVRST
jgi:hypothetical protein